VHHYDIVHQAMDVKSPVAATAMGGKLAFPKDNTQWPDTFSGILQYRAGPVAENGFLVQYTSRTGCRREQRSHGKWFFGTDGALLVTRGGYWLTTEIHVENDAPESDPIANAYYWLDGKGRQTKAIVEEEMVSKNDPRNVTLFIEQVRNRTKPAAESVEVGHYATIPGHLMNIAWRVGRQIRWDGEKEEILGDPKANALLSRPYRAPWALEA
jgi:hypothetical protein